MTMMMTAVVRNGRIELPGPIDLPDGTEVKVLLPEPAGADTDSTDEGPEAAEAIARTLALMDRIEPFDLTEADRSAQEADRKNRKEWEKAHFDEHAETLRRLWE